MGTGRSAGRVWAIDLSRGRILRAAKSGIAVFLIGLYAYTLFTRALTPGYLPALSPAGSPIPRAVAPWLQRGLSTGLGRGPGVEGELEPGYCGAPALSGQDRQVPPYGTVEEAELPWSDPPPPRLVELREQAGAHRLVAAFRTPLPSPLWDEPHNVAVAARYLAGKVVAPGETVSLLNVIGPITRERGYRDGPTYTGGRVSPTVGGGVCKVATGLYNALVYADLEVLQRHPHSMPVPYVPPGRDAALATGYKDVRFRNQRDTPVILWAGLEGAALFTAIYGQYEPPVVEWGHEELGRQPTWYIRRASPALAPGEERTVIAGQDGVTVRSWTIVAYPGKPPERREMGTDRYNPLPGLVEYGSPQ